MDKNSHGKDRDLSPHTVKQSLYRNQPVTRNKKLESISQKIDYVS